jgi:hypothetical protein
VEEAVIMMKVVLLALQTPVLVVEGTVVLVALFQELVVMVEVVL